MQAAKGLLVDATSRQSALLRVSTELEGGWALEQLIGLGGSAAVYRGRRADGCVGAVKVMHAHLSLDAGWQRRFQRETELLRQFPCSGVARVLEVGPAAGPPFFVMELLQGQSLEAARVARGGTLPTPEVLAHADAVLQVLSAMHAVGVVHRDLKPSNLFLSNEGELKVLDFGIATASTNEPGYGLGHTTTRGILGTPAFMPPEQARGRWDLVDARSDLWALGATLFTLLSGEVVHLGGTENERLGLAMVKPARSLRQLLPRLHPKVIALVDRALAYDARDRFQSADEFRRGLQDARLELEHELAFAPRADATVRDVNPPGLPTAPRKRWSSVVAAASVVAALGFLGWQAPRPGRLVARTLESQRPSPPSQAAPVAPEPRAIAAAALPAPLATVPPTRSRRISGSPARIEPVKSPTLVSPAPEPTRQPLDERVISQVGATSTELLERRE
jgi:serine/threonine-protein kinase